MKFNTEIHHRKSIRLRNYDYTQAGCYFLTICAAQKAQLFGDVVNGKMSLNEAGDMVKQCWLEIPQHFPSAKLDEFVVMPNHVHGIVIVDGRNHVGANDHLPLRQHGTSKTIGSMIRGFKIGATKWFRTNTDVYVVWQRNYYERIIRNESELLATREYICNNPLQWELDEMFVL